MSVRTEITAIIGTAIASMVVISVFALVLFKYMPAPKGIPKDKNEYIIWTLNSGDATLNGKKHNIITGTVILEAKPIGK